MQENLYHELAAANKPVLASLIKRAANWQAQNGAVRLVCPSRYALSTVTSEKKYLESLLSRLAGQAMRLEPQLAKEEPSEEPESLDPETQLIIDIFQGEIVNKN